MRHAHCCIKEGLGKLLEGNPEFSVAVGAVDCWERAELNNGKAAVNIVLGADQLGPKTTIEDPSASTESWSSSGICVYANTIPVTIEIYTISCNDTYCEAKDVEMIVLPLIMKGLKCITRITYDGSDHQTQQDKAANTTVLKVQFRLDYFFSPEKPWLLLG